MFVFSSFRVGKPTQAETTDMPHLTQVILAILLDPPHPKICTQQEFVSEFYVPSPKSLRESRLQARFMKVSIYGAPAETLFRGLGKQGHK